MTPKCSKSIVELGVRKRNRNEKQHSSKHEREYQMFSQYPGVITLCVRKIIQAVLKVTCIPEKWHQTSQQKKDVFSMVNTGITTLINESKIEGVSLDPLMTNCIELIFGPLTVVHLVGAFNAARHVCDSFDEKIGGRNQELYARLTIAMVKFFALWNVCMDSPLGANFAPVIASETVMFVVNHVQTNFYPAEKCAKWLPGFVVLGWLGFDAKGLPVYTQSRVPSTLEETTSCLGNALADMVKNSPYGYLLSDTGCGFTHAQLRNPAIAGHAVFMILNGWEWYIDNYDFKMSKIFPTTE
jgi:hypothetical protein